MLEGEEGIAVVAGINGPNQEVDLSVVATYTTASGNFIQEGAGGTQGAGCREGWRLIAREVDEFVDAEGLR
jgi:hypothetical protein